MYKGKELEVNLKRLQSLTKKQLEEMHQVEREAIGRFEGQLDELESALGMLRMGHHFGWRVLVLIHDKRTVRKYEEILGINVREYFHEEGPSADRCRGYRIAKTLKDFWKAVRGEVKIEGRREIGK
jgi:hypothetical protein